MKYLKRFNESVDFELSDFFSEISEIEFYQKISLPIDFTKEEKKSIKDLFDKKEIWVSTDARFNNGKNIYIQYSTLDRFYSKFEFSIYKLEDEWYYVLWSDLVEKNKGEYRSLVNENKFFKCDQWEGLIKFIDTKFKKINSDKFNRVNSR